MDNYLLRKKNKGDMMTDNEGREKTMEQMMDGNQDGSISIAEALSYMNQLKAEREAAIALAASAEEKERIRKENTRKKIKAIATYIGDKAADVVVLVVILGVTGVISAAGFLV